MNYKTIAVRVFGSLVDKYGESFSSLKKPLSESDMKLLFKTYVSLIFFATASAFLLSALSLTIIAISTGMNLSAALTVIFVGSLLTAAMAFFVAYIVPIERAGNRKRNIEANMPFAVNHMAAVASSGVPPNIIFKLINQFGEYEELSKECGKIVRNVESFGQDITTAISQVAAATPADSFRELLYGMLSIIKTGGSMRAFLQTQAKEALFLYRIHRQEYLELLSTYADFYTAVLIAAPLFLISILAVINIIGGSLGGLSVNEIMTLGIFFGIPAVNTFFLLFIHVTQPEQV